MSTALLVLYLLILCSYWLKKALDDWRSLIIVESECSFLYIFLCFFRSSKTREHAVLAYALGIHQVVVAVTKMECTLPVPFDRGRFNTIQAHIATFLFKIGYESHNIQVVPVSALAGVNVVHSSPELPWYRGQSLLEAVNHVGKIKSLSCKINFRPSTKHQTQIVNQFCR